MPDYARGEALMDSSAEEDEGAHGSDEDDGEVILGRDVHMPITVPPDEAEIDLDESQFAELDALAEVNATETNDSDTSRTPADGERTNRLAVVNLDWDHVQASHLFKIFSSAVSSSSAPRGRERGVTRVSQGKVLKVQVFPSEFGKVRLEQERKEGPPKELFKKSELHDDGDGDEPPAFDEDYNNGYDEDVLRKYQLERLRCVFRGTSGVNSLKRHVGIIMQLSLATPSRPPPTSTRNLTGRNSSDPPTCLTSALYRTTWSSAMTKSGRDLLCSRLCDMTIPAPAMKPYRSSLVAIKALSLSQT